MITSQEIVKLQNTFFKFFIPVAFFFSSIFLVGGVIFLIYIINFVYNAKDAVGIVTDSEYTKSNSGYNSMTITPKIKYEVDSKVYEKYSNLSTSSGFNLIVGDNVNILYNPKNPSEFMIDKLDIWAIPVIFTFLGFFGNVMALAFFKLNKKRN